MVAVSKVSGKLRQLVRFVLFTLLTLGLGYGVGKFIGGHTTRVALPLTRLQLFAILPAIGFLVLLTHELGHLAAALYCGFRFHLLTVGFFTLIREDGRIRFRWNLDPRLAGGLAAALPTPNSDVRRGAMWMVIGGPAASLLLAAAGFLVWALAGAIPALAGLITGSFSLLIGVVTSIPAAMGGFVSDGGRFLMLLRGGDPADRWLAIAMTTAANQSGTRPRDWPLADARAEWVDGSPDGITLASIFYCYELDSGREPQAGQWLDWLITHLDDAPPHFAPALKLEAAWYEAARRGRVDVARAWLNQVKPSPLLPPWSVLRAEAAVLTAEGRFQEAATKRTAALALLAAAPIGGAIAMELDLVQGSTPAPRQSTSHH